MSTIVSQLITSLLGVRGLMLSLLLLILLILKEFIQTSEHPRARFLAGALAAAIVPLLLAFGLTVALRLAQSSPNAMHDAAPIALQERHL